jgi:hypothetical protein
VVTGANPSGGFTEGGNVVALAGYFFSEMHDMMCRFGTIGWVAGEWIADDEYRCTAPARAPGFVNVDVGIKGDFALKPLAPPTLYEYFETPELTTVTENVDGSVNIIGSGFTPGDKVFCSLGPTLGFVPGVVIDSNTITCEVPEGAIDEIDPAAVFVLDEDGNNLLAPDPESEGIVGNTQSTIDVVGPTSGPYTGGTTVVIQGTISPRRRCADSGITTPRPRCSSRPRRSCARLPRRRATAASPWRFPTTASTGPLPGSCSRTRRRRGSITSRRDAGLWTAGRRSG